MANFFCRICNRETEVLYRQVKDYFIGRGESPDFQINYCAPCRLAFSLPPLTDRELEPYYPNNYESFVAKKGFVDWLQNLKYKSDLRIIKIKKPAAKVFEIGSGRGEFLNHARAAGYSVAGLEPGAAGRDFAKKHYNLDLLAGYAGDLEFKEKYDLIIARHVFEHLNDPVKILEKARAGLAKDGILFLKLPRLDSWEAKFFKKYWHGFDLPRHRWHYSAAGIKKLLSDSGFHQIEIRNESVPNDIIRSVGYYCLGENNFLSKLFRLFLLLPEAVKMAIAQTVAVILSPLKSGRMIVMAQTNNI